MERGVEVAPAVAAALLPLSETKKEEKEGKWKGRRDIGVFSSTKWVCPQVGRHKKSKRVLSRGRSQCANLSIRVKIRFGRPTIHRGARVYAATGLTGCPRGVRSATVKGAKMRNIILHLPGRPEGASAATVPRLEVHLLQPLSTTARMAQIPR